LELEYIFRMYIVCLYTFIIMMWRNVWGNIVEYLYTCTSVTLADNTKIWSNKTKKELRFWSYLQRLCDKCCFIDLISLYSAWCILLLSMSLLAMSLDLYSCKVAQPLAVVVHVIIVYVTRLVLLYSSPTSGCCCPCHYWLCH
jgi:hypothetical protein